MTQLLPNHKSKSKTLWQNLFAKKTSGTITERANAKINLYLQVLDKRDDNYHNLDSMIVFCNLHDTLKVRRTSKFALGVEGNFAQNLPMRDDNLISRVVHTIAEEINEKPNIFIELHKNIPIAAGLGGGSADAAATLRALSKIWNFSLDDLDMPSVLKKIGSDVPVCLFGKPAFIKGRGDIIRPAPFMPKCPILLVNPNILIETKDVFERVTILPRSPIEYMKSSPATSLELAEMLRVHQNDLMAAASAIEPTTVQVFRALSRAEGCLLPRLSGSGPTCFGIFETRQKALLAAQTISRENPKWWVAISSILSGQEPEIDTAA